MNIKVVFDAERDLDVFNMLTTLNIRKRAYCVSELATNGYLFCQRMKHEVIELDAYREEQHDSEQMSEQIEVKVKIENLRLLQLLQKLLPRYRAEMLRRLVSFGLIVNTATEHEAVNTTTEHEAFIDPCDSPPDTFF